MFCAGISHAAAALPAASQSKPEFARDVRPILSHTCFKCHGPDSKARKADLRLDTAKDAFLTRDASKPAIAPGKPRESALIDRIYSTDPEEEMPPPEAKNRLTNEQKQILTEWIASGADYKPHWAFEAPQQVDLPNVNLRSWPRNPIDHFVLSKIESEGLQPSPRADLYTLIRRLYLDLVGYPPMPEEIAALGPDDTPEFYEKLVDTLLASPHYGERWARRWLDLARYADTNGYEKDRPRSIWLYRNWVINALNADMPFDQFTVAQIAGDMLPNATLEDRIATGFHRNTMLNEEGGIDPLEFRFHAMTDRVATTGRVWLGLTIGCAQCHTHKFDPITQREYYQFMAFLNNADEPELDVPNSETLAEQKSLQLQISSLISDLPNRFPAETIESTQPSAGHTIDDSRPIEIRRAENLEKKFNAWQKKESANAVHWTSLRPIEAQANLPILTILDDNSVLASGDQTKSDTYRLRFKTDLRGITAFRLEAIPDNRLPRHGPGRVYYEGPIGDFTLCEFAVISNGNRIPISHASHSHASGKFTAEAAVDGNPQTGWSINGGQGRPHAAIFDLESRIIDPGELEITMLFERHFSAGLGRFRVSVATEARPEKTHVIAPEIEELLLTPKLQRTTQERDTLLGHFLLQTSEVAKEREEIENLRKKIPRLPTTLVMQERGPEQPRPTYVHNRGEFLQPTENVTADVLSILPALPDGAPHTRLSFAQWLASPSNSLVGRVTMNRQWAAFFGRGLVRTLDDFGYQGELPTHPELLDWLAVEFVKQGWSFKAMRKLIVMSATYQQSSQVRPELLSRDPSNQMLARGPRVRLEAELIRDTVLQVAGLLSPKIGGPSVFPPQPANITTEGTYGRLNWKVSEGADRYRRGLYTFSKRTAPYAMFSTFDAPSGEACVIRREVSNTPLQALTLLNDAVFTEAAQAIGRMMANRPGTVGERLAYLFRRCLTRSPAEDELAMLEEFYQNQKLRFDSGALDAETIAGEGENANERAAWTTLARALFNLDEAITKG